MALYRAAQLAKENGKPYVQILGGEGSGSRYGETTIIFALVTDSPAAPAACRKGAKSPCYTADVGKVIQALSGESGNEPGVAKHFKTDEHGRQVTYIGFGIGAVAAAHPLPKFTD